VGKTKLLKELWKIYKQFLDGYHGWPMTNLVALIATIKDEPIEPEVLAVEEAILDRDPVSGMYDICYPVVGHGDSPCDEHRPAYPLRIEGLKEMPDVVPVHVIITHRIVPAPERVEVPDDAQD
jgi:hypothetical protein